jgi:hypothetical protein
VPTTGLCNAFQSTGATDVPGFITNQLSQLGFLIGMIFMVMIIYAGARMIFSGGDQGTVTKAKETMKYAVGGFLVTTFAFVIVTAIRTFIGARNDVDPNNTGGFENPLFTVGSFQVLMSLMIRGFLRIAGLMALLYLVVGGFRYLTAGGNDEQLKSARQMITWAVIGLITIIVSYTIYSTIIYTLNAAYVP